MRHPVALTALAALLVALAEPAWAQAGSSSADLAPRAGPRYPRDPDGHRGWRHDRPLPRGGGWWGPDSGWMVQEPSPPALFFAPAIPLPMTAPPVGPGWVGAGLPWPNGATVGPSGSPSGGYPVGPPGGPATGPPGSPRSGLGPPPTQFWYWCADPRGYYPAVPTCNGPWQELAATQTR